MSALLFAVCVALATTRQLTPDVTALPAPTTTLTSIVVADIDRDGDADVVATDDALHLFVWLNDGTGHLTQQRPARATTRTLEAHGPDLDGGGRASEPSAPSDPPAFDAQSTFGAAAPAAWRRLTRLPADAHLDDIRTTERLRGPPRRR